MSEPWVPEPPPEENSNWDPDPPHCPECGRIIEAHPSSRADGRWEGWCEKHGTVVAVYSDDTGFDIDEEEEEC